MIDVLSDILDTVALKAALYFRTDFHPPFGVAVPKYQRAARFHLIAQGQCIVRLDDETVVAALPGDLVFVPHGSAHVLASDREIRCKPLADVISAAGFTGQGPFVVGDGPPSGSCQMVCGHFNFAEGADHPLLRALPEVLHISATDRVNHPMLDDILRLLVRRMFGDAPGAAASVSRLSEVLFIEVARAGLSQASELARMMVAIDDPQIGRALGMIHANVAAPWTVERLASAVAMSRSRFAERFSALMGCGPMAYLGEWRLQRARCLLLEPAESIKQVAARVGYQSPAAFSRAFTDRFGRSPSAYRNDGAERN